MFNITGRLAKRYVQNEETMNSDILKSQIVEKVSVTSQMVSYSKSFFISNFQSDTRILISDLLQNVEASLPDQIVIHSTVSTDEPVSNAAKAISWKLAGYEAIWSLIGNGHFLITSESNHIENINISWTTVIPGSGGTSSGLTFDDYHIPIPLKVCLRPSGLSRQDQPISDPDLFLHELNIEGLDIDIEVSLSEAVKCFKHELFLGCLALLGRASEGAWIELGKALANKYPENMSQNGNKLMMSMEDPFIGIGKKISLVLKAYERKDIFGDLYKISGVRPLELKSCVVWSDSVRESRNSIHYGANPAMTNSYEKVAALLIGTVPNLKTIYGILNKCKNDET